MTVPNKIIKESLSPFWDKNGPWFVQTCIHFTQRCLVPGFIEISPVLLEKIYNVSKIFPCKKVKWLLNSFHHWRFVPIWLNMSQEFRKSFSNNEHIISLFCYNHLYLFLKGESAPSFKHTWIPFVQRCFGPSLVEIDQRFLRRRWKCVKFKTTTTVTTNKFLKRCDLP